MKGSLNEKKKLPHVSDTGTYGPKNNYQSFSYLCFSAPLSLRCIQLPSLELSSKLGHAIEISQEPLPDSKIMFLASETLCRFPLNTIFLSLKR